MDKEDWAARLADHYSYEALAEAERQAQRLQGSVRQLSAIRRGILLFRQALRIKAKEQQTHGKQDRSKTDA